MGEFLTKEAAFDRIDFAKSKGITPEQALKDLENAGFEVEGYNADFNPVESLVNVIPGIPKHVWEVAKGLYQAATSPITTMDNISNVGRGAIREGLNRIGISPDSFASDFAADVFELANPLTAPKNFAERAREFMTGEDETVSQRQADEQAFDTFFEEAVTKPYGSTDKFLNTLEKDPVRVISDLSIILTGGGATVKGVATTAKIPVLAEKAAKVQRFANVLEPTIAVQKGSQKVMEALKINKALRTTSEFMQSDAIGITPSKKQNLGKKALLALEDLEQIPENPTAFMVKHGVPAGLEEAWKHLGRIGRTSSKILDQKLSTVTETFKPRSATALLNEMKSLITKEFDDVIQVADEVTETIRGKRQVGFQSDLEVPQTTVQREIPSEQRSTINIPKENLSAQNLSRLNDINNMLSKMGKNGRGLTLSELNRAKRLGGKLLKIFKDSGERKGTFRAENLGESYTDLRRFIENMGRAKGIKNVRKLNQQTQLSFGLQDVIEGRLRAGRNRSPWLNTISFAVMGGGAYAGLGIPTILAGAAGVQLLRLPKIKSFLANRVRLLADREYKILEGGIRTGKRSGEWGRIYRQIRRDLQKAFPEIRFLSPTTRELQQEQQQERIPIR